MQSRPNFTAFVAALVRPLSRLAKAQKDLIELRTLDTAVGAQLDVLRRVVGQPSADVDEETMRTLIRARALANRCRGVPDEILRIARLVLQDYAALPDVVAAGALRLVLVNEGAASYALRIEGIDVPWDLAVTILLATFLVFVTGAGIRVILEFVPSDGSLTLHSNSFRFDGDATDGGGFGSVHDDTIGGAFVAAMD